MGSRGSNNYGNTYRNSITVNGNDTLEFEGELRYGKEDSMINTDTRQVLREFETKRKNAKIEFSMIVGDDGIKHNESRGGKKSVSTPFNARLIPNTTLTHNHPREEGMLGGTFSPGDLTNFVNFNQHTYRAAAKEGVYSISKNVNFDGKGFIKYYKDAHSQARNELNSRTQQLNRLYTTSNMEYNQYLKAYSKEFNTYLLKLHNKLLDGRKQYHYEYTLEK